jgi:general secretion pathway protein K
VAPARYDHLFDIEVTTGQGELSTREAIVCEILDWADADEELCDKSGPEDRSIYQSLDTPYDRKNAPFDSLEELHLVSGINDDFWATFIDPNPEEPESRVVTVWGKGNVNVNTAPASALLPLICMVASDENGAGPCSDPLTLNNVLQILQAVLVIRELVPFSSTKDFLAALAKPETRLFMPGIVGITIPSANRRMANYAFTASSSVFSIYSDGTVGQVTKRIHTVVDMQSEDLLNPEESIAAAGGKVLYWRMD